MYQHMPMGFPLLQDIVRNTSGIYIYIYIVAKCSQHDCSHPPWPATISALTQFGSDIADTSSAATSPREIEPTSLGTQL